MESLSVLAFRIFVMLSCLIIVPMAAIFGSAFPDVVKTVLVDRIVAWSTGKPLEAANAAEGDFSEVTAAPSAQAAREAPRWGTTATNAGDWQAQNTGPGASGVMPAGAAGVDPQSDNQSASFATPADPTRAPVPGYPAERAPTEAPYRAPDHVSQPGGPPLASPNVAMPAGEPRMSPLSSGAARPMEQPDRFTLMERKLREYGATYYLLETWGNEGDLYRFHCKMAVGNNSSYTRHFEATDRDALRAMAQVLEKVEAWRAGRVQ